MQIMLIFRAEQLIVQRNKPYSKVLLNYVKGILCVATNACGKSTKSARQAQHLAVLDFAHNH